MSYQTKTLVLAAGKGTRMKSNKTKVLHELCGKSMLGHVLTQLSNVGIANDDVAIVVGHGQAQIREALGKKNQYIEQLQQLGTGHAVIVAEKWLKDWTGTTLVLAGDIPLITAESIQAMLTAHKQVSAAATVLTADVEKPFGYGRIVRSENVGNLLKIVEEKDASNEEKLIKEINSGIYCFDNQKLLHALTKISSNNAQKEYYLTDVIGIFANAGETVLPYKTIDKQEIIGVNDRVALAEAAKIMQKRINKYWMQAGVTIIDPDATYIDASVTIGQDTTIHPHTTLKGATVIADDCLIGPQADISDSKLESAVKIQYSVIKQSYICTQAEIGPFAYIRPGSKIGEAVKIGDFVEIKNANIGKNSKVAHLSYIGDADIGSDVNIGCGTITVNYDGKNKHRTVIKDKAFIGSNSNLIAPIVVEENGFVAAGSTITKDVPAYALAVARGRQSIKEDWVKKYKNDGGK